MFFNSASFLIFFIIFFIGYWFITQRNLKAQNIFILLASYIFYGWWDWRFVFLLILSTCIDYFFGLAIYRSTDKKKLYLWLSIFNNLIILCFFKYYNFFAQSVSHAFTSFGFKTNFYFLKIILPVGISFYTFHGMSYVLDVYRGKLKPVTSFIDYSVFVCFFPLLVAGPIERANHLLPQVVKPRKFNYGQAVAGIRLILWGLFKKIIIADTLAVMVNEIFNNYTHHQGSTLFIGAIYFAFQIYGDFSGYTDIALGTAKMLGFELLTNFKFPYFSRDIAEFWRRWHISLSSWFRDYVYVPLGGSKHSKARAIRNIFIIFILSGFWHGANWTYLIWGLYNAILFIPLFLFNINRKHADKIVAHDKYLPGFKETAQIILTFLLVTIGWIFFRAKNVHTAFAYLSGIKYHFFSKPENLSGLPIILIFIVLDWLARKDERNILSFIPIRAYIVIFTLVLLLFKQYGEKIEFIYFQF